MDDLERNFKADGPEFVVDHDGRCAGLEGPIVDPGTSPGPKVKVSAATRVPSVIGIA
ncbi:MAG: hypothetical protein O7I42_14085 [Alphaproteobacteria bacterium]|nr:hypothetical protein [Alphaproteobacteria bacterium]